MSLSRNTALERKVFEEIVPSAQDIAEYWTGTMWERIIVEDTRKLVALTKQHDYRAVYPLMGHIKKKLAEARSEQERAENESDQL